jgi:hypothetical protein
MFGLVFQQAWMVVAHAQPVPASLWQGWVENLCVRFSSHHMKIKGCNSWQWPGTTGGKTAFFSTSCSTAGYVAIGHPICIINMPHLTVIIRHNCRLYRLPVLIAVIAFSGRIVNVCQEAHVSLVPPLHSWSLLECQHVSISVSWVWGPWACPF